MAYPEAKTNAEDAEDAEGRGGRLVCTGERGEGLRLEEGGLWRAESEAVGAGR